MCKAGINVCIGTDGAASNNDLDMLGETRTAGFIGKSASNDAAALPALDLLRMATINGARALGIDDRTGSLEVGKQADLTSISFDRISMQPVYDPISHLVYSASRSDVQNTWVNGRQLLSDGKLIGIDTQAIIDNAKEWSMRIRGQQT